MTYYRRPGSVEEAILKAIAPLTPCEARRATGRSRGFLYRTSNPMDTDAKMTVVQALALDHVLAEKGLPLRFRPLFNAPTRARVPEANDLLRALRRLSAILGEAATISGTAVHWADLGTHEAQGLARQLQDLAELSLAVRDSLHVTRQ